MIDERMRIAYCPIKPEGDRRERQHEVATDVAELLEDVVVLAPGVTIPKVGNQPSPVANSDQQAHAEEEVRRRVQDQREPVADVVDDPAAFPARVRAEREPERRSR